MLFREGDHEYAALVAENGFIIELQVEIERVMDQFNVTQSELAHRMGVSDARISQILSGNGKNLSARSVARIAFALGMEPHVEFSRPGARTQRASQPTRRADGYLQLVDSAWLEECNDNKVSKAPVRAEKLAQYAGSVRRAA